MTFDERVRAIRLLGLTARQSAFLVTVALHGGFCLRRQYLPATGRAAGGLLLERLVARRLAARVRYSRSGAHLYQVRGRRIYDAIGHNDNRLHYYISPALMARSLMLLDYVLAERAVDWYATEQDKLTLFSGPLRVPLADLPQRVYRAGRGRLQTTVRYFVHNLPIAVTRNPAVPSFVYLASDTNGRRFRRFLRDHARLLGRLATWTIVAVCPRHIEGLEACREVFDRFVTVSAAESTGGRTADLRDYFTTRQAVEQEQFDRLSVAEIDRFGVARRRFSGPAFESLYANWRLHGDPVLTQDAFGRAPGALRLGAGRFVAYELANSYREFGSLAGRG